MLPQYPKDRSLYKNLSNMFGVRFLGNGLVTDHKHDHWHKQRKIMDPAFSRTYLIGLLGTFNDQAEEFMKELEKKADGETKVDMMCLLRRVTLDIIAKVAFGLELNTLYDEETPFPHAVNMVMKGISNVRIPLFKYMPRNRQVISEIRESLRLLRHTGKQCIEQRRKAIQNEEEVPLDILTQILKNAAQEGDYDEENMLDNFVAFFVAGHETTANQLSFTVMELGRQPDIVAKLQAEVDEVIGVKRDIAYEDLGKLKYLSQVLKEVLRLYPPAPHTIRWTKSENIIEGVKIPANTTLINCVYAAVCHLSCHTYQNCKIKMGLVHTSWDEWKNISRMHSPSILTDLAKINQSHTFPISHFLLDLVPVLDRCLHRWRLKWYWPSFCRGLTSSWFHHRALKFWTQEH
ncbi:cholesterol 24-hydroxylase-like isoform X2 [Sceloporus undulatus]|uniref:cholesterol 24-hydroxylase-like isoform X2 n=1 Tax=Sceloporus undulatus TaxID=8520 RepID=UPI001C4C594B|nr:cholesterol 24-hydroxylase-like isoform X2 [Sceloporus undulatus]